jgi:hypothetical protein
VLIEPENLADVLQDCRVAHPDAGSRSSPRRSGSPSSFRPCCITHTARLLSGWRRGALPHGAPIASRRDSQPRSPRWAAAMRPGPETIATGSDCSPIRTSSARRRSIPRCRLVLAGVGEHLARTRLRPGVGLRPRAGAAQPHGARQSPRRAARRGPTEGFPDVPDPAALAQRERSTAVVGLVSAEQLVAQVCGQVPSTGWPAVGATFKTATIARPSHHGPSDGCRPRSRA